MRVKTKEFGPGSLPMAGALGRPQAGGRVSRCGVYMPAPLCSLFWGASQGAGSESLKGAYIVGRKDSSYPLGTRPFWAQRPSAGCLGLFRLPASAFRAVTCLWSRDGRSCHSAAARLPSACAALNVSSVGKVFTSQRPGLPPPLGPPDRAGDADLALTRRPSPAVALTPRTAAAPRRLWCVVGPRRFAKSGRSPLVSSSAPARVRLRLRFLQLPWCVPVFRRSAPPALLRFRVPRFFSSGLDWVYEIAEPAPQGPGRERDGQGRGGQIEGMLSSGLGHGPGLLEVGVVQGPRSLPRDIFIYTAGAEPAWFQGSSLARTEPVSAWALPVRFALVCLGSKSSDVEIKFQTDEGHWDPGVEFCVSFLTSLRHNFEFIFCEKEPVFCVVIKWGLNYYLLV